MSECIDKDCMRAGSADAGSCVSCQWESLTAECDELRAERDRLRDALTGVEVYGSDTLSGRTDGPNDAAWYREGVAVMRDRARAALGGKP